MKAQEPVVLIRKQGEWVDRSHRVERIAKTSDGKLSVQFSGESTIYTYNPENVKVANKAIPVECTKIEYEGKEIEGFSQVLEYPEVGFYRIVWKDGKYKNILKRKAHIHIDILSSDKSAQNVIDYYRSIAEIVGQHTEEGGQKEFLKNQFARLEHVDERSALAGLLQSKLPETCFCPASLIFPFGLNKSQHMAVSKAFSSSVSIIEEPPGTGKTQTILSIIANVIVQGGTIAVCSNNNEAVKNVREKLEASGYGGIVAMLGCVKNEKDFFSVSHPSPDFPTQGTRISKDDYDKCVSHVLFLQDYIEKTAWLSSMLDTIRREETDFMASAFPNREEDAIRLFRNRRSSAEVHLKALSHVLAMAPIRKFGFWRRLRLAFGYGILWSSTNSSPDSFILHLKRGYYTAKIKELEGQLQDCRLKISRYAPDDAGRLIKGYSRQALDDALRLRVKGVEGRTEYDEKNYRLLFPSFTRRFPVVLSSTYSLRRTSGKGFLYDYLIIDEASQVGLDSAVLALSCARNLVVVGDQRQLPQIDDDYVTRIDGELQAKFAVPKGFGYHGNNILSSIKTIYGNNVPVVMLREHYRCQKDIITFSNRKFYGNALTCLTKPVGEGHHLKLLHTVPGNHARRNPHGTGQYNERELDEVVEYVAGRECDDSIAVIVPYRYQAGLLRGRLPDNVKVDTIHKFQGRECDEVIFSTVANSSEDYVRDEERISNFVNNDELINVAMTRARNKFTLITSDKIYREGAGTLGDLVRYMRYETHCDDTMGNVRSVFDILYDDYAAERRRYLRKKGRRGHLTEILIAELLERILSEPEYASYKVLQHPTLSDVIVIKRGAHTREEYSYLANPWTHVDFAIINVFDKKPVLLIEVDGISYHEQNERQSNHDAIKDKAISMSFIKLIRLKTNGSNEEQAIRNALQKCI